MKNFFTVFLSLHVVLMLYLTFIENAEVEGFKIQVDIFQIYSHSKDNKSQSEDEDGHGLPLPVPIPSPPPPRIATTNDSLFSDKEGFINSESPDKTLSVSRPTLNAEEGEFHRTTPLPFSSVSKSASFEEISSSEEQEILAIDTDELSSGYTYEEINTNTQNETIDSNSPTTIINLSNDTIDSFNYTDYNQDINYMNFNYSTTGSTFVDNSTEYLAERENFLKKTFKKILDPQHITLVYFFGGFLVLLSAVGAMCLTRKLIRSSRLSE